VTNYKPQCQRYERKKIHTSYSAPAALVRDMLLRLVEISLPNSRKSAVGPFFLDRAVLRDIIVPAWVAHHWPIGSFKLAGRELRARNVGYMIEPHPCVLIPILSWKVCC
jgi:hypothetical protein